MNFFSRFTKKTLLVVFFTFSLPSLVLSQDRIFLQNFEQEVQVNFVVKSSALMISADEEQTFMVEAKYNGQVISGEFHFLLEDEDEAQILETGSNWVKVKSNSEFKVGSSSLNVEFVSSSAWGRAKGNIVTAEVQDHIAVVPLGYLVSASSVIEEYSQYGLRRITLKKDALTENLEGKNILMLDDISIFGFASEYHPEGVDMIVNTATDTIEYYINSQNEFQGLFKNIDFQEETNGLKVSTQTSGDTTTIKFYNSNHLIKSKQVKNGLVCKSTDGSTPSINVTSPSLDFDFDLKPIFDFKIENGAVTYSKFAVKLEGNAKVDSGSVSFNSDLSGGAECLLNIGNIDLPKLRFLMFGIGFSGDLSVGLSVEASFDGPTIELSGPKWQGQFSHTKGFEKYGFASGFSRISESVNSSKITSAQTSADFGTSISGSVSPFVRFDTNINFELGVGALAYDILEAPFAKSELAAKFNIGFAAPFDVLDPNYTGPKWDLSYSVLAQLDENIQTSQLQIFLIDFMGVGLDYLNQIDEGFKKEYVIATSPEFETLAKCFPNCPAGGAENIQAQLSMKSEDMNLSGLTTFYVENPLNQEMREVGFNSISLGQSSVDWTPMPADRGNFAVYSRTSSDLLSKAFPYASTHYSTIPVGEGLYTWRGNMDLTNEVVDFNCGFNATNACSWALFGQSWVDGSSIEFVETELMSNRNFHARNLIGGNQTRRVCQQFSVPLTGSETFVVKMNFFASAPETSSLYPIDFVVNNQTLESKSGLFSGVIQIEGTNNNGEFERCNASCKGNWQVSKDYNYSLNEKQCDFIFRPDEGTIITINPFTL